MIRKEISVFSKPAVFDKIYKDGNKVAIRYNKDRALIPVNQIMFYNGNELEYVKFLTDMPKYLKDCFYFKDGYLYIRGGMDIVIDEISPENGNFELLLIFYPFSEKYKEYQAIVQAYYDENEYRVADYAWELVDE